LRDAAAHRPNHLVSLSDDELSPAALAARVVVRDVARQMVADGSWPGTDFHGS
jgi:LysR family tcuABC transcriptional regulator